MISFWANNVKRIFFEDFFLNQIFNKFIVCMWTARYTTMKNTQNVDMFEETDFLRFSQNHNFRKLTTDFENRTKRPAETKAYVVLDVDR